MDFNEQFNKSYLFSTLYHEVGQFFEPQEIVDYQEIIQKLAFKKQYQQLWELVFQVPFGWSSEILEILESNHYQPLDGSEVFSKLCKLHQQIDGNLVLPLYKSSQNFECIGELRNSQISPSTGLLAIHHGYKGEILSIFDWKTGVSKAQINSKTYLSYFSFFPNSGLLVIIEEYSQIHLVNILTREHFPPLVDPDDTKELSKSRINQIALSSDGKLLATGSDYSIKIWDLAIGKYSRKIKWTDKKGTKRNPHGGTMEAQPQLTQLLFSSDNQLLLTAGDQFDRNIKLWKVKTGECFLTLDFSGIVGSVCFTPNNKYLVATTIDYGTFTYKNNSRLIVWDLKTGECKGQIQCDSHISALTLLSDGKRVMTWHYWFKDIYSSIGNQELEKIERISVWEIDPLKQQSTSTHQRRDGIVTQFSFVSNNQGIITHCKNERKPPILRVWESLSKIPLAHMDRSYLTRVQTQLELCQDSDKEIWQFLICLLEYSLRAEFELKLKPIIDSAYVGDNKCLTELANLLNDNNEYIKQLASKVLANLENKRAIDEVCRLIIEQQSLALIEIAIIKGYLPTDESLHGLFYLLTKQFEAYLKIDPELQQLFSLYNNLDKKKQQAIASLIKDSKDLRFAQFIEFNSASNLATRSDKEWQTLIELKIQNQLFDDLWKWVFQAPPRWSSEILAALEKANFQPSEISDQELFQQLSQLRPVSGKNLTFFTISSLHELTGNWFNPSLAISPDGSMLIIGNDRGAEAQIWKIPEWKCYATFCGASESMAFSADGKTLATAISRDYYNLDVWDLSKIELNQHSLKNCYKCSKVCEGKFCQYCGSPSPEAPQLQKSSHKTTMKLPAVGIAFSPDCKILLAISPNKTVELINTTTWHRQTKFKINECYNCAISPNFRFLATAGDLRFWDLKTGNAYPVLMPHTSVVAFSPDGSILATGHSAEARLWDVDTQKCIDILRIPDSASLNLVSSIAISSNKLLALSQQQGNNIFIWDLISQQIKVKLEHSEQVKKLLFSPDSKLLFVVGSSQLKVWKLTYFDSLPLSSMTETEIKQVALLSQGKPNIDLLNWKFVAALLGNRIQSFVEVDSDKESIPQYQIIQTKNTNFIDWRAVIAKLKQSKEFDKLWPLVFETPVHLAAEIVDWLKQCNYRPVNEQDRKNFEKLSSLIPDQSQLPLYTPLPVFRKSLRACPTIISSDNKIIATLDYQGKLSLWDAETNEHIGTLSGHKHIINKALFSPDNSKIATSEHWTVSLWDLVAQKWKWKIDRFEATEESAEDPFYGIKIHYEELDYLVFSPNSKIIAIWSRNKAISLYDTDTGKLLCYLTKTESVFKVSFSPDSSLLLLKAFRNIQICQTTTGKLYAPLLIECNTFAFIPNTNFLIIQEKTKLSQWDLNNGKECIKVKELEIKPLLYDWIIFSKDNNSFALIDRNLTVQIYNLASFQLQSVTTTSELYQSALWANPSITEHNFVNTFPFTMQLLNQELIYYPKRKEQELYDHLCVDSDKHSANSYFLRLDGQEYLPNHLTLSPDYTMLVLGTEKFLHLWDLNNGTCKLTLAVNRAKSEVFIGSNLLATFSKRLQIWDINTACLQLDFPIDERQMVKLWPDSKNIIITKETKFERWNIDRLDYKSIKQESLYSIFFKSNDERFLVTLQKNNSIKLWDLYLEKCLLTIGDCSPNDFNCWFSSDNQLFWVLPKSFKLYIYNIETSELRIWEHKKENYGHTLSPDGQLLVIWGISNSFWLWRLSTGDCQEFSWSENGITEEVYGRPKNQGCVRVKWLSKVGVFSPCSKKIAFQTEVFEDNTHKTTRFNTYIWDIVSGRGTKVLNQKLCSLDFSTSPFSFDSKWLGTINSVNDTTLSLIDVNDAKNSFSLNVGFQIKGVIFSPDNQTIAISGEQDVQILVNGKTKLKLKDHTLFSKYGSDIAQLNKANFVGLPNISMFSISGKVLAVWETNGKIINIYDIDSLQPIAKLNDCGSIYLFTFLPNNKAIALNSDFTVLVWQENDFRKG